MGIVSEACKERIRERVPLEDVVREHNVHLVASGRRLKGLCPFHTEKTPSFTVDVERQYYYCFGCQAGGDVFSFVRNAQHLEFSEALEILARRAGVSLEFEGGYRPSTDRSSTLPIYEALVLAEEFYHQCLLDGVAGRAARQYLEGRQIQPEIWEKFRLGYSPPEWDAFSRFATKKGVSFDVLERAGLVRQRPGNERAGNERASGYDAFRGRVMFPIRDAQGRVTGFGARTLGDDVPKYLNTPRTPVFDKSQVLYGIDLARGGIQRESRIGIVEGYTDAIVAHQMGLDFVVASLGTAFTTENARRLGRLAPRALLIFDGDDAGQKAAERSLDLLVAESIDVRIYTVTDGKDPCDAILRLGGAEFRRKLESDSVGLFEFKWRRTLESDRAASSGVALRAKALDEFLSLLARVPNVVARRLYIREFAERIGIPESEIAQRMEQVAGRSRNGAASSRAPARHDARRPAPGTSRFDEPIFSPESGPLGMQPVDASAETNKNAELAELVLGCMLALPGKAREIWSEVPEGLLDASPYKVLAQSIDGQLVGDALSIPRLTREINDPEALRILTRILNHLEDDEGRPTQDFEETWLHVRRDLLRHVRREKLEELKRHLAVAEAGGGSRPTGELRREYFEMLREIKR